MILAAASLYTLILLGDDGRAEFGPFNSLRECQVEAIWHYATQPSRHWHDAVCVDAGGHTVRIEEKGLPENLRRGQGSATSPALKKPVPARKPAQRAPRKKPDPWQSLRLPENR